MSPRPAPMPADPDFEAVETERLTFRRFRESDLTALVSYRNDPDVARYQGWVLPYTGEAGASLFAELENLDPGIPGEWFQFAIEERSRGEMIGDCDLRPGAEDPALAEIGFTFATATQGRGYATEAVSALLPYAFERLAVRRIVAHTDARNIPSIALLERLGMRWVETRDVEFESAMAPEHVYELTVMP